MGFSAAVQSIRQHHNHQSVHATAMRRAIMLMTGLVCYTSSHAFEPYRAEYRFTTNDFIKTNASRELIQDGDLWRYVFTASLVKIGTAKEVAIFKIVDNEIIPMTHSMDVKVPFVHKYSSLKFDQDNNTVHVNDNGKQKSYAIESPNVDDLSIELQVRMDIKQGKLKPYYNLVENNSTSKTEFVVDGNEQIQTPAGKFDTIKVHIKHFTSTTHSIFWLAPKLDYLPVRIQHMDYDMTYQLDLMNYVSKAKK